MSISAREGAPRASQDVLLVVEREAEIELLIGKDASRRCARWTGIVGPRIQWRDATNTLKKFNCVSSVSLTSAGNNLHFDKRFAFIVLFTTCFDD